MRKTITSAMVLLFAFTAAAAPTGWKILKEINVGGDGGWDYLTMDSEARRLYLSHATQVVVVDPDAGRVVGHIADTPGVHGIALVPALNRGFITNGRSNNVTIFDTRTLTTISQVAAGQNPDAVRYEPRSGRVFTFNGTSKDSTVIDGKSAAVVGTIPLGGKPEFAVADDRGHIYVNIEDTGELVEIDAAKAAATKRYSLKPCEDPTGLAIDVKKRRLFSVCGNRIMTVSDPDAGKVIVTVAIGAGSDGAAFDPQTGYAMSSNGDGTLTIVQEVAGKYQVLENVATARGARTITLDDKTHNVYLPVAEQLPPQAGQRRGGYAANSFKVLIVGKP
jgi:YVTN family beta-propeller protein